MSDETAKQRLAEILETYQPGGVLLLLAELLNHDIPADPTARESLRDVVGALTVVGLGLDLVYPSGGE